MILPPISGHLVIGASGFIGSHLARRLALAGGKVTGTCTGRSDAFRLRGLPANFLVKSLDLPDPDSVERLFASEPFDTVFHLAAAGVYAGAGEARATAETNTVGAFALAQAALRHGVRRFVYCGTAQEYQPTDVPMDESVPLGPQNIYAASKAAGWVLMDYLRRIEGLPMVTLRLFGAFGPGESASRLIPHVIRSAMRNQPIQLTGGLQVRDYLYVDDVVDALLLAGARPSCGIYNIGGGPVRALSVQAIAEMTLGLMGLPRTLCRFGEANRSRPDPPFLVADSSRAKADLGWSPRISLEDGLRMTITSIRSQGPA